MNDSAAQQWCLFNFKIDVDGSAWMKLAVNGLAFHGCAADGRVTDQSTADGRAAGESQQMDVWQRRPSCSSLLLRDLLQMELAADGRFSHGCAAGGRATEE